SPLMLAAYHGHAALVRELAARGADVDLANDRGQSPLAGAAFKGFTEVATALLEAGADPRLGTPSALEKARYFERAEIVALLDAPRGWAPPLAGRPAGLLSGPGSAHHRDVLDAGLEEQSADGLEAHRGVPLLEVRLGVDVHVRARQSRGDMLERGLHEPPPAPGAPVIGAHG